MRVILVSLICACVLSVAYSSLLNLDRCPSVEPMKNLNLKLLNGDWYLLIANTNPGFENASCIRSNINLVNDEIVEARLNFLINKAPVNFNTNYTYDKSRGAFKYVEEVTLKGFMSSYKKNITGELIVVDTDYYNYQLVYTCVTLDHFWLAEKSASFFLYIKTRYFDSLRTILPLMETLKTKLKIDLNKIAVLENSISCRN